MKMRRAIAAFAVVVLAASACSGTGHAGEIPTESAARAFLAHLVSRAEARDLTGFCQLADSICELIAEESGGVAAIPPNPPIIAGTRVIPTRQRGDAMLGGGQLLVLCGIDGFGKPYRTEMLVSVDYNGALFAINGVYWSGAGLAISQMTGGPSGGDGIECPGA
jgi:hypothetical protein